MSDPETPPPAVGPVEAGPGGGGGDPLAGSVVGERYRLIERIGEGGMGAVYRGEHTLMKKVVAVKLLHPELGRLDEVAKRFEREAQSASRLSHENIIQVTDFGRTPSGQLFLVMELLRGESLAELLARERALPPARAVAIARQILLALDHAHAQGVVHRDLKPANIMLVSRTSMMPVAGTNPLSPNDRVKILDFGIAKMSDPASDADAATGATRATPLTEAGVVFGTPEYMSPEQATGESADGRADLYACGVILFEMLAGRRPFESESRVGLLAMHLTAAPPPLRRFAPEAPAALEAVVLRALEKRREQRFATAAELLAALDAAAGSTGSDPQWITGARRRLAPIALRIEPIRRIGDGDRAYLIGQRPQKPILVLGIAEIMQCHVGLEALDNYRLFLTDQQHVRLFFASHLATSFAVYTRNAIGFSRRALKTESSSDPSAPSTTR